MIGVIVHGNGACFPMQWVTLCIGFYFPCMTDGRETKNKRRDAHIKNHICKSYKNTEDCVKNIRKIRVVAAAIVAQGRLLIAQRGEKMSSALLWEVPGGKVEDGESDQEALKRELKEELNIEVEVCDFVGMSCVVVGSKEIEMYVYRCNIQKGDPQALEHKQLMWASESDLLSVSWAPADIPLIPQLVQCTKGN